jgi:hypothetical protein
MNYLKESGGAELKPILYNTQGCPCDTPDS